MKKKNESLKKGISIIVLAFVASIVGAVVGIKKEKVNTEKQREYAQKHLAIMQVFNEWLAVKQKGKSIEEYLLANNVKTVAIYGLSYLGERLYYDLKNSNIEVKYAIDQNADKIYTDIDVYKPDEKLEKVDLIIVTAFYFFEEIECNLSKEVDCKIVSLEDILYEL